MTCLPAVLGELHHHSFLHKYSDKIILTFLKVLTYSGEAPDIFHNARTYLRRFVLAVFGFH